MSRLVLKTEKLERRKSVGKFIIYNGLAMCSADIDKLLHFINKTRNNEFITVD